MSRLIQERIKQPLAEELLFGKLVNGGEVKIRIKDNNPVFEITPAAPKATKPKGKGRRAIGGEPDQTDQPTQSAEPEQSEEGETPEAPAAE